MRLGLYCAAGFLFDWLQFVFSTAVVIRAEERGASATVLGLLQGASTGLYVLNSLAAGPLADRHSKAVLARIGCVAALATCAAGALSDRLGVLFAAMGLMGLASSLYWPALQAAVGAEASPGRLDRDLGLFNVAWSLGKALGFVSVGWMAARWGHATALLAAAASALPILVLLPRDPQGRPAREAGEGHADRDAFRTMGWIANFAAFGLGAAFANQYIKVARGAVELTIADPKTFLGIFLGTIFGAQTLAFGLLQRGAAWTYRRGLSYALQAGTAGVAVGITLLRGDVAILAAAPLLGAGLGFSYASSIYYSLHGPAEHGRFAGIHEAVLGAGTLLVPIAGGKLADLTGDLRMPYWLAAGVVVASLAAQEAVYRRRSRS
jgi:MFS family permease